MRLKEEPAYHVRVAVLISIGEPRVALHFQALTSDGERDMAIQVCNDQHEQEEPKVQ